MCNQTFCTFAAPNCGILFDYYLVYFSITIYKWGVWSTQFYQALHS